MFGLAVEHAIIHGVDLCSSFLDIKLAHEICVNISFFSINYYWDYCDYCRYCAGKCSAREIGLNRIRAAQGPFLTVQLFGAWSHQVQWCEAGVLQPVPCKTISLQSPIGSRYD